MALKWTTSSEAALDQGVKFLIHSPPGYGKTALVATMPNPCIISAEAGLLSLLPENQIRMYGRAVEIPVIEIKTAADLVEAGAFFKDSVHAKELNPCLDSCSEIAEVVLGHLLKQVKDPRQAYGEMAARMTEFIRFFRDLPNKHVYFTAMQDSEKDSDGVIKRGPAMPGKQLTQKIGHFFDEVFALDIGELPDKTKFRYLRTQPNIKFHAKDRSGALLEMEEPNLTTIINKIQNSHV